MLGIVLYEYAIFDNVSSKFPKNTKKILTHYRFANLLAKLDRRFEIYKNFSANPRQDKTSHLNSTNIGNKQLRQKLVQKKEKQRKTIASKKQKRVATRRCFRQIHKSPTTGRETKWARRRLRKRIFQTIRKKQFVTKTTSALLQFESNSVSIEFKT